MVALVDRTEKPRSTRTTEGKGATGMSVAKASLLRLAALSLLAGIALAIPAGAKADLLGGLSIRAGAFIPTRDAVRRITDFAAFGGGLEYKVPWFPNAFTGESWSTSISVDFHYSQRGDTTPVDTTQIYRYFPVSINQVFTFEEQKGFTPYAGVAVGAHTWSVGPRTHGGGGTGGTSKARGTGGPITNPSHQPTITRFGGGLILGVNWGNNLYWEGRYEWIQGGSPVKPEGFRTYVGFRF
jgi:hypothetical protein